MAVRTKPTSFGTLFQQVQGLRSQKKDPLTTAANQTVATQTKGTQQATQQTTAKSGETQAKTGQETLKTGMQSAASGVGATPAITSNWQTPTAPAGPATTDTSGWESFFKATPWAPGEQAQIDLSNARQTAINQAEQQQAEVEKSQENYLKGLTDYLAAPDRNLGMTAAPSQLEQDAAATQNILAQETPSNIQALQAILGGTYDPRLATIESNVYQGDLAGLKSEAQAGKAQSEQAEAQRQRTLEDYLKGKSAAQQRVTEQEANVGLNAEGKKYSDVMRDEIEKDFKAKSDKIVADVENLKNTFPMVAKDKFVNFIRSESANANASNATNPSEANAISVKLDVLERYLPLIEKYAPDQAASFKQYIAQQRGELDSRRTQWALDAKRQEEEMTRDRERGVADMIRNPDTSNGKFWRNAYERLVGEGVSPDQALRNLEKLSNDIKARGGDLPTAKEMSNLFDQYVQKPTKTEGSESRGRASTAGSGGGEQTDRYGRITEKRSS